jgi:DNA-binding NtrC family response regulator
MSEQGRVPGLKDALADYERRLIRAALERHGGHQRRAAAALGLLPSTLVEKMKRLGIPGARRGRETGQVVAFVPAPAAQRFLR